MVLVGAAALAAGAVNAIAGGGSLITFPTLVAVGLSPVTASITNTVALCPGYLGATLAQRRDLAGQGRRAALLLPIGAVGGVLGALLLLGTGERAFDIVVPFLLLLAALLVGFQTRLRGWLFGRDKSPEPGRAEAWAMLPVGLAAIYGGYFGAGLGVMVLAALGIVLADNLIRINALKQSVSLCVNVAAAVVFLTSGRIDWPIAGVMLVGALLGGVIGGKLASRIPASYLRTLVVVLGIGLSIVYFARL
ncbi:MAG: sulfite exporter TauE/SafE family protein [Deltaproteobacteria bacterium]|nr:sulfite exporter TauE/SafE family protein [Deltaproteobacteria bacterium]